MSDILSADNRLSVLSTAERYYRISDKFIQSCSDVSSLPNTVPTFHAGFGTWEGDLTLSKNGQHYILHFEDSYQRISESRIDRVFTYDFRLHHNTIEIFRFDNHGKPLNHTAACHCHCGTGQRLLEGDPALKQFSMVSLTLCDAVVIASAYVEEGKLPWL
ncbi:hypothetical protein [Granulicella arctica]|uniref:hypothetical protein n=1 Tax=Granulicella arctica TaxID=940613 RepID=UPI0021DFAD3A|nr:hypothetical protein [Granulicella arctica]